jgi:photosystem II stability/assembly factor-like uncharacterized protein
MKIHCLFIIYYFFSLLLFSCEKDNQPSETITETKVFNTAQPTGISFANQNVGYISGGVEFDVGAAVIAKTVDGGASWEKITVYIDGHATAQISSIFAKSADTVYISYNSRVDEPGIGFSKDGGLTWNQLGNLTSSGGFSSVYFINSQVGIVCSGNYILRTLNGGLSWVGVFKNTGFSNFSKLFFTSKMVGYAYGGFAWDSSVGGIMVKTSDGGDNWMELTSLQEYITCLSFVDDNTGYAFAYSNSIYKTDNGGATWTQLNSIMGVGSAYYSAIVERKAKYFGSGHSIFKTTDDFKTITSIYRSPVYLAELSIKAIKPSENTLFFLSSQQSVIKVKLNH